MVVFGDFYSQPEVAHIIQQYQTNRINYKVPFFFLLGTKHKTILEARSGLGPIKAYPRLGPKPSGEQGGGLVDPNTQERTFHCEICNVRVNSELQLKQVEKGAWVEQVSSGVYILSNCGPVFFTFSTYQVEGTETAWQASLTPSSVDIRSTGELI